MSENTALEEIKLIEAQTRKAMLTEIISDLKREAKEIKRIKFYTDTILKEMGYSEKDCKSVIDYITNWVTIDEALVTKQVADKIQSINDRFKKTNQTFTGNNWGSALSLSTPSYFWYTKVPWSVDLRTTCSTDASFVSGLK